MSIAISSLSSSGLLPQESTTIHDEGDDEETKRRMATHMPGQRTMAKTVTRHAVMATTVTRHTMIATTVTRHMMVATIVASVARHSMVATTDDESDDDEG